ncbi:hypothetical protein AC626_21845 [Pseudoalteromonas rubra]|uniref:Uncharacterized protein n=1 Tax=Pseudoalteromonas rubra TaxID=43658 RepID=A0A0L0EP05_9GAMM|nr:hypothetical protein AC626_21845 [Pseudoalteromonas rubra]
MRLINRTRLYLRKWYFHPLDMILSVNLSAFRVGVRHPGLGVYALGVEQVGGEGADFVEGRALFFF